MSLAHINIGVIEWQRKEVQGADVDRGKDKVGGELSIMQTRYRRVKDT